MSTIVIYDVVSKAVKQLLISVNTPDYDKRTDVLVNPDLTLLKSVAAEYVKVSGTSLVEMSTAEKTAVDAAKPVPEPSIESRIFSLEGRVTALETRATALEKA
jgi:hypothetical protein